MVLFLMFTSSIVRVSRQSLIGNNEWFRSIAHTTNLGYSLNLLSLGYCHHRPFMSHLAKQCHMEQ